MRTSAPSMQFTAQYFRLVCVTVEMASEGVKAILFDLDNTLIETSRAGEVAARKTGELLRTALGLDDDAIGTIWGKFKQKLLRESFDPAAGIPLDEVRVAHWEESLRESLGGAPAPSLAAQCYYTWKNSRLEAVDLSPPICRLLEELRRRYKLLLLTNGATQPQREKVEAAGCERFFDAIVFGGEYTEQKPFPSVFRVCFNILGVEAQDCVMVGDSLDTDIQGGLNAGVRATVWISSAGVPDGPVRPDYTIPTVLELPNILTQLG